MFITPAEAQGFFGGGGEGGGGLGAFFPIILIFVVFYFLLIRPQQKKQKAHTALVSGLQVGDEILTAGGILGKVTGVSEHYAVVKIGDDTATAVWQLPDASPMPA